MRFDGAPRKLPPGHSAQQYWNRKHDYAINAQIVGGPDSLIYDVDACFYGSANDAHVYEWSKVRPMLENNGRFHVAGDSAYPMSPVMIKLYPIAEAANHSTVNKRPIGKNKLVNLRF